MNKKIIFFLLSLSCTQACLAHGPVPTPLSEAEIPPVPGLLDGNDPIVADKDMAIALGKALFWDTNVGSDGMACGSCHFHAGADSRVKHQLNPGTMSANATGQIFEDTATGPGGANTTLSLDDFPFHKLSDPFDRDSNVVNTSDDVVSSSGTFSGEYIGSSRFTDPNDECSRESDSVFHVNQIGTRRVEPRNAPTVINAIFNHRNFWDGRANSVFNGSSAWGERDPDAGVWVKQSARSVVKQRLHLENSSLASLSVQPPLSDTEMSCRNRTWPEIGRKLLYRKPLQYQNVHHQDSVFAPLALTSSDAINQLPGLNTTYLRMIRQAFDRKYWSYSRTGPFGSRSGERPYNQTEANFAMFFGIALQLYQGTLISDQALIDTCPHDPVTREPAASCLGEAAHRGLAVLEQSHCNLCHSGPTMSTAAVVTNARLVEQFGPQVFGTFGTHGAAGQAGINKFGNVVTRSSTTSGNGNKLMDFGYFNTGVADPESDPGIAGVDDFGNPLSLSTQYIEHLSENSGAVFDQEVTTVRSCDFSQALALNINVALPSIFTLTDGLKEDPNSSEGCFNLNYIYIPVKEAVIANAGTLKLAEATKAAFKAPTFRNIELTGPYMHNGSMATLEQVIEFYSRGGNFVNSNMHQLISQLPMRNNAQSRSDLLALLKTFTDERVRYKRAPFDHPEIRVPNGHAGDNVVVEDGNILTPELAKDEFMVIPAVGANGSSVPLKPFHELIGS